MKRLETTGWAVITENNDLLDLFTDWDKAVEYTQDGNETIYVKIIPIKIKEIYA